MPPCNFRDFAYIFLFRKILSLMPCNISWGSSYIRVFILDIKIPFYLWWIKCVLKFRKTPSNYEKACRSVLLVSWHVYSFAQSTTSIQSSSKTSISSISGIWYWWLRLFHFLVEHTQSLFALISHYSLFQTFLNQNLLNLSKAKPS